MFINNTMKLQHLFENAKQFIVYVTGKTSDNYEWYVVSAASEDEAKKLVDRTVEWDSEYDLEVLTPDEYTERGYDLNDVKATQSNKPVLFDYGS